MTQRGRHCDDFVEGVRRFIIGLGKKVLIANTLGNVADQVFGIAPHELNTPAAWLGIACYTLQIYFDFSGYSDMAIGLMRMFGFRVLENFNYPYISQSIREFWRRWHISLSNFFRDYLYIPLGGNRARQGAHLPQSGDRVPALRSLAWRELDLHRVGRVARAVPDAGARRIGRRAASAPGGRYAMPTRSRRLWADGSCSGATRSAHARAFYAALGGGGADTHVKYPLLMYLDPLVATTLVVAVIGAMPVGRALAVAIDRYTPDRRGFATVALVRGMVVAGTGSDCLVCGAGRGHLQSVHLFSLLNMAPSPPGYLPDRPRPAWFGVLLVTLVHRDDRRRLRRLVPHAARRGQSVRESCSRSRCHLALTAARRYASIPRRFERFFDDRFGMRATLVHFDHWVKAIVFGVSPVSKVLIGKSGLAVFSRRGFEGLRSVVSRQRNDSRRHADRGARRVAAPAGIPRGSRHSVCGRRRT